MISTLVLTFQLVHVHFCHANWVSRNPSMIFPLVSLGEKNEKKHERVELAVRVRDDGMKFTPKIETD
jgi:hypothetical protein